jgi:hypothetical protein
MTPGIRAIDMNRTLGQCGLSRGASSALLVLTPFLLALPQLAVAPGEPVVLLDSARAEVAANATNFSAMERTDALFTKLAILESQTDAGTALNRARAIRNPFYSSLALGGIAATAIRSNPSAATNHFCEALVTSRGI